MKDNSKCKYTEIIKQKECLVERSVWGDSIQQNITRNEYVTVERHNIIYDAPEK